MLSMSGTDGGGSSASIQVSDRGMKTRLTTRLAISAAHTGIRCGRDRRRVFRCRTSAPSQEHHDRRRRCDHDGESDLSCPARGSDADRLPEHARRWIASVTTMLLSTTMPTDNMNPISVRALSDAPQKYIAVSVMSMLSGIAAAVTNVIRKRRRNAKRMRIANRPPQSAVTQQVVQAAPRSGDPGRRTLRLRAVRHPPFASSSSIAARIDSAVATVFSVDSLKIAST